MHDQFIEGCRNKGLVTEDYANELWDTLIDFADYCLAGDTEVIVWEDDYAKTLTIKEIVDQQLPASVFSFDLDNDGQPRLQLQTVSQWHDNGFREVRSYTLEDGTKITCTPDHKFMTKQYKFLPISEIFKQKLELATAY